MLLIQVKLVENVFTPGQKSQIIAKLTDAMVSIEGENKRPVTLVVIEKVRSGDRAIGGKAPTAGTVHASAAPAAGNELRLVGEADALRAHSSICASDRYRDSCRP